MKIAFYAPLKPPDHANPSGDRLLARLLLAALRRAGHEVEPASRLRAFEGRGDAARQTRIREQATAEADRLLRCYRAEGAPDAWFTYHVYHKAPDWIGPAVCAALDIPYLVAEASVSPSQAGGPWQEGHRQAMHCLSVAAASVVLNRRDLPCAAPLLASGARTLLLAPFIDLAQWPPAAPRQPADRLALVTVARMRDGDKARSWQELGDILARLDQRDYSLDVVGDGPRRHEVEQRLRAICGERLRCHGRLEGEALAAVLDQATLMLWPARNEAFGMVLLEAASRALAVVAGRDGGVAGVVRHGRSAWLYPPGDVAAAATAVDYLARRPAVVTRMGECGRALVREHHGLDAAARRLGTLVDDVVGRHG